MPRVGSALLLLVILTCTAMASNSQQISASLPVGCPFYLNFNTLPTYPKTGSISLAYIVHSQASCTIPPATGTLEVVQTSSNQLVLSNTVSISSIGNTAATYNVLLDTNTVANTTYTASIVLTGGGISNSSTASFSLLNPANMLITGLSTAPSLSIGSQVTINIGLKNTGQYSTTGSTLYLTVNGPASYSNTYSVIGLLPGQSLNTSITIGSIANLPGTYTISIYNTYSFMGANYISNSQETSYTASVPHSQHSSSAGVIQQIAIPIQPLPNLVLNTAPFIISAPALSQSITTLDSSNPGQTAYTVNFSIPDAYSGLVKLSADSEYLLPNQQQSLQVLISPNQSFKSGSYVVPLNISINRNGLRSNRTEYMVINVYNASQKKLQAINFVSITNYTAAAQGVIEINNPSGSNVSNATLQTLVPAALVSNQSQITTQGLQSKISKVQDFYTISWQLPFLRSNSSSFAYYEISKPTSQLLLENIQNVLMQPQPTKQSSIITLLNTVIPPFYTNSSGTLQLQALYTGTGEQQINFTLTSASGITIKNALQSINATPNQLISPSFTILTSAVQGTFLVYVKVIAQGYNYSYAMPLTVMPNQTGHVSVASAGAATQPQIPYFYAVTAIALIILTSILIMARRKLGMPKYTPERAERMVRLREQIKREKGSD